MVPLLPSACRALSIGARPASSFWIVPVPMRLAIVELVGCRQVDGERLVGLEVEIAVDQDRDRLR